MAKTVIEITNLNKDYRIGEIGTGTLSHDLNRWWASIRGKEDPVSKISKVNDRTMKADGNEIVSALKNINLEIKQGDLLAVIGRNGAGKSTLLKVLSRVTSPTTGSIKVRGRIASLLEVGTGFHPEMTGRENIYMNGTIMGMRRKEIDHKLERIVDFAGVAKYLDTPTKRYSSGMTVRLGFAIAAFLDPEILIIDEVLAVGDIEFQRQAINRMNEVSQEEGRTVIFVSHVMENIARICKSGIVLDKGEIILNSDVQACIDTYDTVNSRSTVERKVIIDDGSLSQIDGQVTVDASAKGAKLVIDFHANRAIKKLDFTLHFFSASGTLIFMVSSILTDQGVSLGRHRAEFSVDTSFLKPGEYFVALRAVENKSNFEILRIDNFIQLVIPVPKDRDFSFTPDGVVAPRFEFGLDRTE